jgi:ABC-2 type transport system permease protein
VTTVLTKPLPDVVSPYIRHHEPRIPFSRLLRVEWGKATDTRAARWLLLTVALTTTGLMLAPLLAKNAIDQTQASYLACAALALTVLLPVVAMLTLTSEWSQRTVLATFTQEPRRARVIQAKVCVSLILAALGSAFGGLVTAAAVLLAELSGRHIGADISTSRVVGFALFVLLNVLMGVAFGALLHNTAAAIVLFFALPMAFTAAGTALRSIGQWVDPSLTFGQVLQADWSGHLPQILTSTTIWLVAPLAAGLIRTIRREIK